MFLATNIIGQHIMEDSKRLKDNWFFNGNIGISQAYGDLSAENPFEKFKYDTRIGLGLIFGKQISPVFGVRGQSYYGKLKSILPSKSDPTVGEYFTAYNVINLNTGLTINLSNLFFDYYEHRIFTIYGVGGIGLTYWESTLYDLKTNKKLKNNKGSNNGKWGYSTAFTGMLGMGGCFKITDHLDISLEVVWNIIDSDDLDCKTGGSPNDYYSYISTGLAYKFSWKKKSYRRTLPKKEPLIAEEVEKEEISEPFLIPEPSDGIPEPKLIELPVVIPPEPEVTYEETIEPVREIPELEFRVQIRAAYARPVTSEELEVFGIPDEIREEFIEGWYKYMVGSFDNLDDVMDYKNLIRTVYSVHDAFVVAYLKGKRLRNLDHLYQSYSNKEFNVLGNYVENIRYGVQISASYLRPLSLESLLNKYNLDEPVREDFKNNWYRYSVGLFNKYWKAKEYRNILLTRYNAKGCFVVVYKDEIRYTVLELLGVESGYISEVDLDKPKRDVVFRVQILCLDPVNRIPSEELNAQYNILEDINEISENHLIKYQIGNYKSYDEACTLRHMIIDKGINDAFVVAYHNDIRIPISEAFE
jgi:hypothetical protein